MMQEYGMFLSALAAFCHYLAAFVAFATLLIEYWIFRSKRQTKELAALAWVDLVYGIAALVLWVAGILRVVYFEKGLQFYLHNQAFLIKMGLLVMVGVASIYPTTHFISWERRIRKGKLVQISPRTTQRIRWALRLEIVGMIAIISAATFINR